MLIVVVEIFVQCNLGVDVTKIVDFGTQFWQ